MKHLISYLYILAFVLVLSTVFVVRQDLGNGVVSGKYFRFYFAMGVIALVSFAGFVRRRPVRFKLIDGLILLYEVVTLAVSCFVHPSEAATKHILLTLVILLYFYFRMFLSASSANRYWVMLFFLATGLVEAIWGLRQLYGFGYSQHNLFRLTGSFFNPGPYACYLAVALPAAAGYLLRDRGCTQVRFRLRYWPLYLRWAMALLTCVGIILVLPAAMSRAAWLAAVGGCGLVACPMIHKFMKSKIQNAGKPLLYILAGFLIVAGGIGMYRMKKDSADGRALTWKIALQTAVRHPMGVGIGNFSGSYGHEQAAYFSAGKGTEQERHVAGNPEYGFNEYLQIAVEQGAVPFVLFVSIMGYSLCTGIRRKRTAATAALLALLIAAVASYPFSVLPFLIVTVFLLAWIHSDKCAGKSSHSHILLWIFLFVVAGCLYNRYPTYRAFRDWRRSTALYHAGAYESGIAAYAPLYPLLSDRTDFLFEYAQCLSKSERYEESNAVLKKAVRISCDPMLHNIMGKNHQAMKRYAEAEACFLMAANIVPNRIYPWFLLANLYVETGETEKAGAAARTVLTKEPKVQSTAVREMREKMKKLLTEI